MLDSPNFYTFADLNIPNLMWKSNFLRTICLFLLFFPQLVNAQNGTLSGKILSEGNPVSYANIGFIGTSIGTSSDSLGNYQIKNIPFGNYKLKLTCIGYSTIEKPISLSSNQAVFLNFTLYNTTNNLNEVVVTGTMKEVSRSESPVPVEIYTCKYFLKNPTPNIFDALQNINGVRPQLNCNICATGDIHINGLEGPYTMILIDGMPIVSGLSTVYGLSGIPNSMIERVEIVKGPASSLYGSEAVGGLVNVITKKPENAPLASVDVFGTGWGEYNLDLGLKLKTGKFATVLSGINYFNFQNRVDNNNDNFTDIPLQNRISLFQKWNFIRKENRVFGLAARYLYENRWGGEKNWETKFRGSDIVYGESIYTKRVEIFGNYELPTVEKLMLSFSYNNHNQDSRYGTTIYDAQQNISFAQLTWDKKINRHDLLLGAAIRYTFYDDNTPATSSPDSLNPTNQAQKTYLPGIFIQDEISFTNKHKLLLGFRYDYNSIHGNILTPRVAYKWKINDQNILRLNAGTGFRVVNLFTEDHAALTGSRVVEIKNELNPESSCNVNLNYLHKIYSLEGNVLGIEASAFYTHFNNRIVADYEQDPNKIIYDNLDGYAVSRGLGFNFDLALQNGLILNAGATLMDNTITENGRTQQQILTENFTGVWSVSYKIEKLKLGIDYTGNFYSPMRLPLLGTLDPRKAYSPWWSIQNIQFTYLGFKRFDLYGGVKNFLNWTPNRNNPFIIARSNDPFDKEVQFNSNGQVIPTANNPYALSFDPSYVYGPNQGARMFLGIRYQIK